MAKRWRSLDCGPCSFSVARAPGWLGRTNMSPVCFGAPSVNSLLTQGTHRHAFQLCQAATLESLPQALTSLPLPGAPTTPAGLTCAPGSCFPHKPGRPTPSRAGEGSTRPSCNPVSRVITTVPASQQAGTSGCYAAHCRVTSNPLRSHRYRLGLHRHAAPPGHLFHISETTTGRQPCLLSQEVPRAQDSAFLCPKLLATVCHLRISIF